MKDDYDLSELQQISVRGLKYNVMPRYLYHYTDKEYEKFSLDLLDRLVDEDSVSIDIGGHYGIYSLLAARKSKKVYTFEPVPENYTILTKNIKANGLEKKITAINKATSDSEGVVEFNVPWASDSAGFYEHPNAETVRKIQVETNSIDRELKGVKDVSFIKIDTEGHELHVLDGMRATLLSNRNAKMLIEFNPECLHNAGAKPEDLIEKILSLNYEIFALYEDERHVVSVTAQTSIEDILQGRTYLNFLCLPVGVARKLFFVSHNADMGGAELVLLRTIMALTERTDAFVIPYVVLPGDGPLTETIANLPVASCVVPMRGWTNIADDDAEAVHIINSNAVVAISKIVSDFKPDAVITNTLSVPWGAFVAKAYNIPHVWSIHEFGDLDHNLAFNYGYDASLQYISELSTSVIVNSRAVQGHLGGRMDTKKVRLLYPPVTVPAAVKSVKPSPFSEKSTLKLVVSGRISPSKGQMDAVKALKVVRDNGVNAELMLLGSIGSQDYYDEIVAYAKKHGFSEKLHGVGFQNNPFEYVQAADIALVCSANEAFGMVTAEAMLLGKPVVATNSGGTTEIISDGKTGLLYDAGDFKQLAAQILSLDNAGKRKKLGEAGRVHASNQFSGDYYGAFYDIVVQAIKGTKPHPELTIFQDLLGGMQRQFSHKENEIAQMVRRHNEELQSFSDEYNKVYAAYEKVDAQLAFVRKSGVIKLYKGARRIRGIVGPVLRRKK